MDYRVGDGLKWINSFWLKLPWKLSKILGMAWSAGAPAETTKTFAFSKVFLPYPPKLTVAALMQLGVPPKIMCGLGWIIKDSSRETLLHNSSSRLFVGSALFAETLAIKSSLIAAQNVFLDFQVLTTLINSGGFRNELKRSGDFVTRSKLSLSLVIVLIQVLFYPK